MNNSVLDDHKPPARAPVGRGAVKKIKAATNKGGVVVIDAVDESSITACEGARQAVDKLVEAHMKTGIYVLKIKANSIDDVRAELKAVAGGSLNLAPKEDSPVIIFLIMHGETAIFDDPTMPGKTILCYGEERVLLAELLDQLKEENLDSSFKGSSGAPRQIHFAPVTCRGTVVASDEERQGLRSYGFGSEAPDNMRLLRPCGVDEGLLALPGYGVAVLNAYAEALEEKLGGAGLGQLGRVTVEAVWNAACDKVRHSDDLLYQRAGKGQRVTGDGEGENYQAQPQHAATPTYFERNRACIEKWG